MPKYNKIYLIGKSSKSWAIGLDLINSSSKKDDCILILDTSKLQNGLPISLARRKFERRILSTFENIKVIKMRWSIKDFINLFHNSFFVNIEDLVSEVLNQNSLDTKSHLVRASLAAKYGTDTFVRSDIKKFDVLFNILVINKIEKLLRSFDFSEQTNFWCFNGRKIYESSFLLFAKDNQYVTKIYERASSSNKYEIYDKSPHSNEEWWAKIDKFDMQNHDESEMTQKAKIYLEKKSKGIDPFENIKWIKHMRNETHIDDLIKKPYIVFYSVSTSEVSPFHEFNTKIGYPNQFEALEDLISVAKELNLLLVIRRHPNSVGLDGVDREHKQWLKYINDANILYLAPTSKINSYRLAENCKIAFTWRSTIGLELSYMNVPIYSLGPSKWAINESQRAFSKKKIREVIEIKPSINMEYIYKFAKYISNFGTTSSLFSQIERWGVQYDDKFIYNQTGIRVLTFIKYNLYYRYKKIWKLK